MTQPSSLLSLTMTNKDISSDYGENHADVNSQIVINDVLAFKNNEYLFRIGKVNHVQDQLIQVTLFNLKLDKKSETINQHDILLKFGNNGSKATFELGNNNQKMLLNKLIELDADCNSFVYLMAETKSKDDVISNLSLNMENMMKKIILMDSNTEVLQEMLSDGIMHSPFDTVDFIFGCLQQIQSEEKIKTLAKFVAYQLYESKCLAGLQHQINCSNDIPLDISKKKFIRQVVLQINKLFRDTHDLNESSVILALFHLNSSALEWEL